MVSNKLINLLRNKSTTHQYPGISVVSWWSGVGLHLPCPSVGTYKKYDDYVILLIYLIFTLFRFMCDPLFV